MTEAQSLDSKIALLRAAKKVFAKKGFDGATVKDIAEEAGVNVSLVSYHYQGKENLYRECIKQFGEAGLRAAERLLEEPKSVDEFRIRLTLFTEELISRHFEEHEVAQIMQRECNGNDPVVAELFDTVFIKYFLTLQNFFKLAAKNKILHPKADPHMITMLFFGSIISTLNHDEMHEKKFGKSLKDLDYRKKLIQQSLLMVLGGTSA